MRMKKFLAVMLTLCTLVALCPMAVFSAEETAKAATMYNVVVENGKATDAAGNPVIQAAEGDTIVVTADKAPDKKVFDSWVYYDGSNVVFDDIYAETTTFVMPGNDVRVRADYKNDTSLKNLYYADVSVKEPKVGDKVSDCLPVLNSPNQTLEFAWFDKSNYHVLSNDYVFEAGKYYYLDMTVYANEGYVYPEYTSVKFNLNGSEVWDDKYYDRLTFKYNVMPGGKTITNIDIIIPEPVAGAQAGAALPTINTPGVKLSTFRWDENYTNNTNGRGYLEPEDEFISGMHYDADLGLKAEAGYILTPLKNQMTLTVNGRKIQNNAYDLRSDALYFDYDTICNGKKLDNMTIPVIVPEVKPGDTLNDLYARVEAPYSDYVKVDNTWYICTNLTTGEPVGIYDPLEAGNEYERGFYIRPTLGYYFEEGGNINISLSGNNKVKEVINKYGTQLVFYYTFKVEEPVPVRPMITVENGDGQVTLKWNPVYRATSYVVYMYNPSTKTYQTLTTTTGTQYTKTGLTNGTTYKFAVRAKNSSGLSPWTVENAVTATPVEPVPAKPVVTVTNGNGQATLKWNPVSGATSYVIYQYNPTTNTYAQIITTTGTSYTKTGLTNGSTYKFVVRAKNSSGLSPWTADDVVIANPAAPALAKPVITVTNGNGQVTLKWNAVSGATSYVIYQYNPTTNTYAQIITTTGTSYTKTGLTNGSTYKFVVRAKNSSGLSPWTADDVVIANPAAPALAKPAITVTNGNGQVTLKWNPVSGATSYVVYQYNTTTNTYAQIITTTGTTYTKTGLTNGTTYKFAVRAKNSYGMSAWTTADAVTAKPVAPAVPAKPVITVTNGNGQVTLKWNAVSGATSYVIYQYNPTTGTYETVITTTATTYTKTGLTNGTTYKFAVRAKNSYGLSPWTTADAVTAKPVVSSVPAKPAVKATAGNGSVTLSWNAVSGATKYYIYMYNTSTGTYQLLTTTTALTYTKTGLSNGTAYKFIVRAYNENGQSAYTAADAVSATPKA